MNHIEDFEVRLESGAYINLTIPTVAMQEELISLKGNNQEHRYYKLFQEILDTNREHKEVDATKYDVRVAATVINEYFTYWLEYVNKTIQIPSKPFQEPSTDQWDNPYLNSVDSRKYSLVYEHFGVDYTAAQSMDVLTFTKLLRDAYILSLSASEEGRKYLYDCWRYSCTDADMAAIMADFPKGKE